MQEVKYYKSKVSIFDNLETEYEDILVLIEMAIEENDEGLISEVDETFESFKRDFEEAKLNSLLDGEFDKNNAILSLHAGAGGTEACDWVAMLYRMYIRYAERAGYKTELIDMLDGEEAGIKSVTFSIIGPNAYGFLKSEKGVHRLVRISPFDSSGRRHTSFAACDVLPEIEDDSTIDIKTEDLKIDTYRASGAGGQHVNTTDSAVRITHIPTGIVVQCQNERSQHKNKDRAMKMLKSKLAEAMEIERMEKLDDIRGDVKHIDFGSQIRSYVFQPYNMVKDHRTSAETGNANGVMDGNIELFINEYLKWIHKSE
jgi:peptide chain release factor 2